MKIDYKKKCIVAQTNDDREVLVSLFRSQAIRGAYIIWTDNSALPVEYSWIQEYNPKAFIITTEDLIDPNNDTTPEEAKQKILETNIKEKNAELTKNLFSFLQ